MTIMDRLTPVKITTDSTVALPEKQQEQRFKSQQEIHYNKRHRTQSLPHISNDEQVWIKIHSEQQNGTIVKPADTTQSHVIETNSVSVWRNCQNLTVIPEGEFISSILSKSLLSEVEQVL